MPIFYRKAIEAAVYPQGADWLETRHLSDWHGLAEALDRLTPEQRCDAIYADWLLRLNENRALILPIRDYLIGQGALAANYLAELAQNADDAADGERAEIRINPTGDWLFVANDGRKVTSLNLVGLSRFFVHAAGQVVELNEKTIGRFGIGFKSCYRIASEVLVFSWDPKGSYGFRLPICRVGDEASAPESNRLAAVLRRLESVGAGQFDEEAKRLNCLGYCTPEFFDALPTEVRPSWEMISKSKRGTFFAFRIRQERREDVARRVSGQEHHIYELCPLFLPSLCFVQIGANALSLGRKDSSSDLPGVAKAEKVTLSSITSGGPQSHSRFWKLSDPSDTPSWQIALHADGQHRLRLDRETDEMGMTLKDGAAYAFFPLNGLNQAWTFRFHLHLKLPTKLERDNWNPEEAPRVEELLRKAIRTMAEWVDAHFDSVVGNNWSFERLIERRPTQVNNQEDWAGHWANIVFEELCSAAATRPLIRTLGGRRVVLGDGRHVEVIQRQAATEAWFKLAECPQLKEALPSFVACEAAVLGAKPAAGYEIAETFALILANKALTPETRQAAMLAYLSTTRHSGASLEETLAKAVIELADGSTVELSAILNQPSGTELEPSWHDCFKRVAEWARDASWQSNHVYGQRCDEQMKKLSYPVFNPPWSRVLSRLSSDEAWAKHGEAFWKTDRTPCPAEHKSVLVCLRLPAGNGTWLALDRLWLEDDTATDCFAGLLQSWPLAYTDSTRKRLTKLLRDWGLYEEWEKGARKLIEEHLPGEIARRLAENSEWNAFAMAFNPGFEESRKSLDRAWGRIVDEAEKVAVGRFVQAQCKELQLSGKIILSGEIPASIRAALLLVPKYAQAPRWLSDCAFSRICRLGLQTILGFEFVTLEDLDEDPSRFAQEALDSFYRWPEGSQPEQTLEGLNAIFGKVGIMRRKDLLIAVSSQKRRRVAEFFAQGPLTEGKTPGERLMAKRLSTAKLHVDPIPFPLNQLPALVDVAVNFGKLRCDGDNVSEIPIERDQIESSLVEDPDIAMLLIAGQMVYGTPHGLNLRWHAGETLIAELLNADVGWLGEKLIFGQFSRPANEEQFVRLLSLYELSDIVSPEYQRAKRKGKSAFDLYSEFRDHVVEVLVRKHVKEVGYGREHIFRELLQNAENAYASKSQPVSFPWFEFRVEPGDRMNGHRIRVRHAGRVFNEQDRDNQMRPDVERIVKINAPNQNTPDELGRFNRGFKSVFTVAKGGIVQVRSGQRKFEIRDLLLLSPAEPKPEHTFQAETEFEFAVSHTDALGMTGFQSVPTSHTPPESVNMTTLLFLNYVRRVEILWEQKRWDWQIIRQLLPTGWYRSEIREATSARGEVFHIAFGKLSDTDGRRFGVAVRIGTDGEPKLLDKEWRKLRLTFETECSFGLDVLVNGDFEADQGRVNVKKIMASGVDIIEAALESVLRRATSQLAENCTKQRWVAWARVLHLKDAREVFESTFTETPARLVRWIERMESLFTSRVPCKTGTVPIVEAVFPSRLMRRLAVTFANPWGIDIRAWIEPDAEEELPSRIREQLSKFSLIKWVSTFTRMAPILKRVLADLREPGFQAFKASIAKPERDELSQAEHLLDEKLTPIQPSDQPQARVELPAIEDLSVAELFHWWEQQDEPLSNYTLEGDDNWPLWNLVGFAGRSVIPDLDGRKALLKSTLLAVNDDDGKKLWYRLFSFACLMSAGRRITEVREFWRNQLEAARFWEQTSRAEFGEGTDALFDGLIARPFHDLSASGEYAYFWRRVFYDIRKIHTLVWENEFPSVLLELVNKGRGTDLLAFLKTGHISGQKSWVGVFGQSAGSPLFFLVRELCRLGVINDDSVRPYAFFVSAPVRRAMERIGWMPKGLGNNADFETLAALSESLHKRISSDREYGKQLLEFYDIPLLHLGLEA